jgi:hypothetical protein
MEGVRPFSVDTFLTTPYVMVDDFCHYYPSKTTPGFLLQASLRRDYFTMLARHLVPWSRWRSLWSTWPYRLWWSPSRCSATG